MRCELQFGTTDTGLMLTFTYYADVATDADVTPHPVIHESSVGNGSYYFDVDWSTISSSITSIKYLVTGGTTDQSAVIDREGPLAGDLTTLENVKAYLGIDPDNISSDDLLSRLITAQSAWFNRAVGHTITEAEYTETQIASGYLYFIPYQFPVSEITSLEIDGVSVPESTSDNVPGYYLDGDVVYFHNWWVGTGERIVAVYTAGYAATDIPADIEQAVIELVALKYREKGHVGTQTVSMVGTSISFLPSIIPNSVRDVVEGYRRVAV